MAENPRGSRGRLTLFTQLAIAAAVGLVVLVAWLFSASRREDSEPVRPVSPSPAASAAPVATPPPLSREALIQEARAVAAAFAAGEQRTLDGADPLVGRRFTLRVPFGCDGPASGSTAAQAYYEVDPERRTLKLVARPVDWSASPFGQGGDGPAAYEAIEGFWIPRPWTYAETCPPKGDATPSAASTPASAQTLGLATFFEVGGSRVQRRGGRPYEHVEKIESDAPLPLGGSYRLVLEGKLAALPTGRAVRCWSESSEHRPICLFAAAIDRVAFEDQAGTMLAEWKMD